MTEVGYAMCLDCGKENPVYKGPHGIEALCGKCHHIYPVKAKDIKWVNERKLFFVPRHAIVKEV